MLGTELIELLEELVLPRVTKEEDKEYIKNKFLQLFSEKIFLPWCYEDISCMTSEVLTDEQCADVLTYIDRKHDANIGVTWDVITMAIDRVIHNDS